MGAAGLLAALSTVTFCGGGSAPETEPVPESNRLYYNDTGGIADSTRQVIRTQEDWRTVWDRATARQEDPPPIPAVDFGESMVLVVSAGRSAPGDQIRVESLRMAERTLGGDTETVLEVTVRTVRACGDFQGETFPVEIVRVRGFDDPVVFAGESVPGPGCDR